MVRRKSLEEEKRILKAKLEEEARAEKERQKEARRLEKQWQEQFQRETDSILRRIQNIEEVAKSDIRPELESMITLVANRKEQERQRAHNEFMRQYHDVMSKAATLDGVDTVLFDEFYYIKYPRATIVESQLPELQRTLIHLAVQYQNCRLALQICNLQSGRASVERKLVDSNHRLKVITQDLNNSFVKPPASGRKNMDLVLQPKFAYLHAYVESQETAHMIMENGRYICLALKELLSESPQYEALSRKARSVFFLGKDLHQYRAVRRAAEFYRHLGHTQVHNLASNLDRLGWKTFGIQRTHQTLKWSYTRMIATSLANWYLPRWSLHPPRHPELDITWKYIDVLHPFDVARAYDMIILYMSLNIGYMLANDESPSPIIAKARAHHAKTFHNWHKSFQIAAGSLETEITSLRYITWARLTTESKIYDLGEVPDTVSRGLFCSPNPLSQDLRKFIEYTHAFASLTNFSALHAQEIHMRRIGTINKENPRIPTKVFLTDYLDTERLKKTSKTTAPADRRRNRSSRVASSGVRVKGKTQKSVRKSDTSKMPPSVEPLPSTEPSPETVERTVGRRKHRTPIIVRKIVVRDVVPPPPSTEHPPEIGSPETVERTVGRRKHRTPIIVRKVVPSIHSKREYSTSSRNTLGWSLEEELKSPVNGADEESYPAIYGEALVASELKSRSSQSPTFRFDNSAQFWSHKNHQDRNGKAITVHYCRTLDSAERVAKLFSESRVIGLDLEWKAQALSTAGIKSNLSLLQIADQDRIALFHIALFQTRNDQELTPPSLKKILESADTVKVGVNIKADCTRVRRYLGIEVQSQLEISHLYKLVKYSQSNPKLVNRRVVNLSQQVEEILGLPLFKEDNVRCSDWSRPLAYTQVQCEFTIYGKFLWNIS